MSKRSSKNEDESLWNIGNKVYQVMKPFAAKAAPQLIGSLEKTAEHYVPGSGKYVSKVGGALPYAIYYGNDLVSGYQISKEVVAKKNELLKDFAPYLKEEKGKASSLALYRSANTVIQIEAERLGSKVKNDGLGLGIGVASSAVTNYIMTSKGEAPLARDERIDVEQIDPNAQLDAGTAGLLAIGVATPALNTYLERRAEKLNERLSPYDIIVAIAESGSNGMVKLGGRNGQYASLEEAVLEAFTANNELSNLPPVMPGSRFYDELKEACAFIAHEIKSENLKPKALISLIGDGMVLAGNKVADKATLQKTLRNANNILLQSDPKFVEEFIAATEYTLTELKQTFANTPDAFKPVLASFLEAPVLKKIGYKDEQIEQWENTDRENFVASFREVVQDILEQPVDVLVKSGLKEKEIKELKMNAAGLMQADAETIMDFLPTKEGRRVQRALLNNKGYWTERVGKPSEIALSEEPPLEKAELNHADKLGQRPDSLMNMVEHSKDSRNMGLSF